MLTDGNRQIQEYTDEQIFTTVYEQGSFEPVARVVQLASHIEQKRLADIAYETRRFVRIGESEETINQRIQDKSQPLINIYHYHCNHLGTPQELTNQDGDVIWLSYDRAWGGSFDTIYKPQFVDNWAINESELQPFKFQGQSLDIETGLHYNRFRYYDSDVGMFISRDPIGLMGGLNIFAYAPNPVMWIDPWGLTCTEIPNKNFSSRKQALRAIKRDLGIPMSEKPIKVTKDVPLTTRQGKQIMKDGNPVMTREYHYRTPKGETVVIQEHSHGHAFGPVGTEGNGICQHSCHPYLNQATKTSLALTRLDGRTGFNAVGGTGEQFLTALPFQRAGFTCFAFKSTDSRLARISPSLSV